MPPGRPPIFESVEDIQVLIDDYFGELKASWNDSNKTPLYPTVTGLSLAIGLSGRQALLNYEGKPEFMDAIKKAKSKVEEFIEQRLYQNNATGCIFNLKNNFGWNDKTIQDLNAKVDGKITVEFVSK